MNFDYNKYPYPSTRRAIFGKKGMVATSSPYATSAGAEILLKGEMQLMLPLLFLWSFL